MLETIAFIPDGNRRYAKRENISVEKSYLIGTKKAWSILEWLSRYPEIKNGIFYTFSTKNFNRPKEEQLILMKLFESELKHITSKEKTEFLQKAKLKVKFIGNSKLFSKKLQDLMKIVEESTAKNGFRTVYFAIGYDGQEEIVQAVKNFVNEVAAGKKQISNLTIENFKKYLQVDLNPDLIIRTSKEQRLSGFLTYQSAYSELLFIDKYWPEINEDDLKKAIDDYNNRDRRFGE
ncbi:MAG: polyprenyl diphosphate synthase [Candidatus ainarchaeum sp.]|nr:polyprenyl diphosphate synthase [Candidatus ainarchaeum sp.]